MSVEESTQLSMLRARDVMPPSVGDLIADKYRLIGLLGRGSMGEVWLAHHLTLRENVAIKLLTHAVSAVVGEDAGQAAIRLKFEAQVAARLSRRTRHIVQVTDHGEVNGLAYLVMESLEGMTLETRLTRCEFLPLSEVQVIVRQVARALEHAHAEGVLHRDLKPSNLFLTQDEDGELLVKVLDFGIARAIQPDASTSDFSTGSGVICGTPGYMSPEQARGQAGLDARCDLWALATIAYEALTNDLPVVGSSPDELYKSTWMGATIPIAQRRNDLPPAVEAFFDRALTADINARFSTVQELGQAFEQACATATEPSSNVSWSHSLPLRPSQPPPTRPEGRPASYLRAKRRRVATVAVAGAFVPLALAIVFAVGWRSRLHATRDRALVASVAHVQQSQAVPPPTASKATIPAPTVVDVPAAHPSMAAPDSTPVRHLVVPIESSRPESPAPTSGRAASPAPTSRPSPSAPRPPPERDRSDVL
jgi:serine/threonine-protein kinase